MIRTIVIWAIGWIVVKDKFLSIGVGYLMLRLKEEHWGFSERMNDNVCYPVVYEAYQRAALRERDGKVRWGKLFEEIETIVETILEIDGIRDPKLGEDRVVDLLVFHKVI